MLAESISDDEEENDEVKNKSLESDAEELNYEVLN